MDGQGRLPDPGLAGHRRHHHRRPCVAGRGQQPVKPGDLLGAAGEVGHRRRQLARRQPLGRRPRPRRHPSEPLRQGAAGVLEPLSGGILEPRRSGPTRPRASARSRTDSPRGWATRPCSRPPIARTLTPARAANSSWDTSARSRKLRNSTPNPTGPGGACRLGRSTMRRVPPPVARPRPRLGHWCPLGQLWPRLAGPAGRAAARPARGRRCLLRVVVVRAPWAPAGG